MSRPVLELAHEALMARPASWTDLSGRPKIKDMRADRLERDWRQLRRGAALSTALVALGAAVFFMDEARLAIESGATLMLVAEEAGELRPGSDVWVAGIRAGKVVGIRFIEGDAPGAPHLEIRAVLGREAAGALRRDAIAKVQPSGLMAPFVVNLIPGSRSQPPYDFGDTLVAEMAVTTRAIAAFGDSLRHVVTELRPIAARLREALRSGGGTLAALAANRAAFAKLNDNVQRLDSLAERPGTLGLLATDTAIAPGLRRALERLEALADRSSDRPWRKRAGTSLRSLAQNLSSLRRRLDDARGTLGRALYDREIQRQARLFRAQLDTARAELAERPQAWLRVRLF